MKTENLTIEEKKEILEKNIPPKDSQQLSFREGNKILFYEWDEDTEKWELILYMIDELPLNEKDKEIAKKVTIWAKLIHTIINLFKKKR